MSEDIIKLILELKQLNPTWGGQRISDELKKIGHQVSKKTVLKYLEIHGLNSPTPRWYPSWSEFLKSHKFKFGIDFTSIISLMGHQLYIFVMIDLDTRKLVGINATYNPHLTWVIQQFKDALFDYDDYPSLCICDNDRVFQSQFEIMINKYFKIKLRKIPYYSPEKNGRTERFHRSLKSEAFSNVVPINLNHAQKICKEYQRFYNSYRPHQGIRGATPENPSQCFKKYVGHTIKEHLGGKIFSFETGHLSVA